MAGKAVAEGSDKDTAPCSRVVPPHIGMKIKTCRKYILFVLPNPFFDFRITNSTPTYYKWKNTIPFTDNSPRLPNTTHYLRPTGS
jgi:hypothetical protein